MQKYQKSWYLLLYYLILCYGFSLDMTKNNFMLFPTFLYHILVKYEIGCIMFIFGLCCFKVHAF